jgi:hypothetical protein
MELLEFGKALALVMALELLGGPSKGAASQKLHHSQLHSTVPHQTPRRLPGGADQRLPLPPPIPNDPPPQHPVPSEPPHQDDSSGDFCGRDSFYLECVVILIHRHQIFAELLLLVQAVLVLLGLRKRKQKRSSHKRKPVSHPKVRNRATISKKSRPGSRIGPETPAVVPS